MESLLLDPFVLDVWVAPRTDGVRGSGTEDDPYDGSTSAKFDTLMRSLVSPVAIRLGPGTLQTKGWAPGLAPSSQGWEPAATLKRIRGSGMEATILQLVGASTSGFEYSAIGSDYNDYLDSFEAADFTVDCNLSGQPPPQAVACAGIQIVGKHTRIRRVRTINFGTQALGYECFPLVSGGAHPDLIECYDDVIEDSILEQPWPNNFRETTCTHLQGGERPTDGLTAYHRACVIRRCFLDCEFRQNPVPIAGITVSSGIATVTTRLAHGHVTGDWVRIAGAVLNGSINNSFNGCYQITYQSPYSFTYTPVPTQSTSPSGDMWVGRFPSQVVQITSAQWSAGSAIITTDSPHFLAPGSVVVISQVSLSAYNGVFNVGSVTAFNQFQFPIGSNPGPGSGGLIGVDFHALSADAGTAAVVEGNRVCNTRTGGPYHDTWNSRDLTVRNNYYRAVVTGPYQLLSGVSQTSIMIPLVSLTNSGSTAIATTATPHGFKNADPIIITGASGPDGQYYNNPVGNAISVVTSPTAFQYQMNGTPSGPATGPIGYATGDRQRHLGVPPSTPALTFVQQAAVYIATAQIDTSLFPQGHGFSVGDAVLVSKANPITSPYNGYFTITAITSTTFQYAVPTNPITNSASGYYGRLWQLDRLVVENNIIELVPTPTFFGPPTAILVQGFPSASPPILQQAVMRRNNIRHVDGLSDSGRPAYGTGMVVLGCGTLLAEDNVVDLDATTPIKYQFCGNTEFFSNQTPGGGLIQGYNAATSANADELSTRIEDAALLAF